MLVTVSSSFVFINEFEKSLITDLVDGEIIVLLSILMFPPLSAIFLSLLAISKSNVLQLVGFESLIGPSSLAELYKFKTEVEILGIKPPEVKPSDFPLSQIGLPSLDLTKTLAKSLPS